MGKAIGLDAGATEPLGDSTQVVIFRGEEVVADGSLNLTFGSRAGGTFLCLCLAGTPNPLAVHSRLGHLRAASTLFNLHEEPPMDVPVSSPSRPLKADEILRIGAALMPWSVPHDGPVWLAMAIDLPNDVIAVEISEAKAREAIKKQPGPAGYEVYGPFMRPNRAASPARLSNDDPVAHDICDLFRPTYYEEAIEDGSPLPKHEDLKDVQVTLTWVSKGGKEIKKVYDFGKAVDAIFITTGARYVFAYPRYLSIFGDEMLKAKKKQLGDPALTVL
ncbi:MAG TPA: hypothetical protein VHE78_06395 [Gemmatimonadaceae bacterium]|nr:hypothetical protein [Gemmatimonadaceae bacterium]